MRLFRVSMVLGLGATGPALAQSNCLDQVKFPEVGRWAEYKAKYQNDPTPAGTASSGVRRVKARIFAGSRCR